MAQLTNEWWRDKDGGIKFSVTVIAFGCLATILTMIAKALPKRFFVATGIDRFNLFLLSLGTVILLFRIVGCIRHMK